MIAPILALVGLTAAVTVLMTVFRNWAVLRGLTAASAYRGDTPQAPDWVERPARTFNNLMQVPTLFYLVCVLMMVTERVDRTQLMLAWTFVALRVAHAVVYMGWNSLHYRFATWVAGCIALTTLWVRFAAST